MKIKDEILYYETSNVAPGIVVGLDKDVGSSISIKKGEVLKVSVSVKPEPVVTTEKEEEPTPQPEPKPETQE